MRSNVYQEQEKSGAEVKWFVWNSTKPHDYPLELACELLITVQEGEKVEFSFERIDLDFRTAEHGCEDFLQIRGGDSKQSDTIEYFCGNVIPKPLKSSGRYLYIRFYADSEYDTRTTPRIQGHIPSCEGIP